MKTIFNFLFFSSVCFAATTASVPAPNYGSIGGGSGGGTIGGLISGGTANSCLFVGPSGLLAQDHANYQCDVATHSLSVGGALPTTPKANGNFWARGGGAFGGNTSFDDFNYPGELAVGNNVDNVTGVVMGSENGGAGQPNTSAWYAFRLAGPYNVGWEVKDAATKKVALSTQVFNGNGFGMSFYFPSGFGTLGPIHQLCESADGACDIGSPDAGTTLTKRYGNIFLGTAKKLKIGKYHLDPCQNDAGNSGISQTLDLSTCSSQNSTLTGNVTYGFSNPVTGGNYTVKINTGVGGYTATWPAAVKWPSGTAPTITAASSKVDIIKLYYDGTDYFGSYNQNYTPTTGVWAPDTQSGLSFWYEADSGVTTSGSGLTQWNDKSTNANNLTKEISATAFAQLVDPDSSLSGPLNKSIQFVPSGGPPGSVYGVASNSTLNYGSADYVVALVFKSTGGNTNCPGILGKDDFILSNGFMTQARWDCDGSQNQWFLEFQTPTTKLLNSSVSQSDNNWYYSILYRVGGTMFITVNGAAAGSLSSGLNINTTVDFVLGAGGAGDTGAFGGNIAMAFGYKGVTADATLLSNINTYMKNRAGL